MKAAPPNLVFAALLLAIACSTRATGRTIPGPTSPSAARESRSIRVALRAPAAKVSGTVAFAWYGTDPGLLARGRRGEQWSVERESRGSRVRAVRPDGVPTAWQTVLVARVTSNGFLTVNDKRYRGELLLAPNADSIVIVNRVGLEDYLRGVVAVEMGNRPASDAAAVQAQAVAARSYAIIRLGNSDRPFDVYSTVLDQAYGGVDVENELANDAVDATRGLVLWYAGRVVDAPYSSTCGGSTAEAPEVWRSSGAPYLRRVSDRIGDSDRFYCDIAPRYRWTRTLRAADLNAALEQYLRAYTSVPSGGPGEARRISIAGHTPSGRVAALEIETDRGTFPVRANEIRFVMRPPGGEILNSTYFSVESEHSGDGHIEAVTFRGRGYGHGIGMCQWGAIGRSRAGQSFRTILSTYYPGTTVGPVQ